MDKKKDVENNADEGVCPCCGVPVNPDQNQPSQGQGFSEAKDSDWKRGFIQKRFNWLLQILEKKVDAVTYNKIIRELGKQCAQSIQDIAIKNKGNPEGYFKKINSMWGEVFTYNKKESTVYIDTKLTECPCPNVNKEMTPPSYCDCSLGWQKFMFETVFGKPVEVSHQETLLRGGKTCRFVIKIKP